MPARRHDGIPTYGTFHQTCIDSDGLTVGQTLDFGACTSGTTGDATTKRASQRGRPRRSKVAKDQLRCLFTSLVMSNIETWLLPPNTGRSFSSALIARRFLESCRPFRLM